MQESSESVKLCDVVGCSTSPLTHPRLCDSVYLASGPILICWSWKTGSKQIYKHTAPVRQVCINDKGNKLAFADDNNIFIIDVATFKVSDPQTESGRHANKHKAMFLGSHVLQLEFIGDRELISLEAFDSGSMAQRVGLWHVKSEEGVEASHTSYLGNHEPPALKCVPSTSDRVFFLSSTAVRCAVIARDGESRQLEFSWRHGSEGSETFIDATFHKLSSWLIVLKSEGIIVLLDEKGAAVGRIALQDDVPLTVCLCRLSDFAVGTKTGKIFVLEISSMKVIHQFVRKSSILKRSSSKDSQYALGIQKLSYFDGYFVVHSLDKFITFFDDTGEECLSQFLHASQINSICPEGTFHQGRHAVYTASSDETVGVWSVNKRGDSIEAAPSKTFLDTASTLHPAISSAKSSFRGIQKHVANLHPGDFHTQESFINRKLCTSCMTCDSISKILACGTYYGYCMIYSTESHALSWSIDVCHSKISGIAIVPGGDYMVVRSHEGLIWILDRISGFKKTSIVHEEVENDIRDKVCEQVLVSLDLQRSIDKQPSSQATDFCRSAIVENFKLLAFSDMTTLVVYLVKANFITQGGSPLAEVVATIQFHSQPLSISLHASHRYVFALADKGLVEVKSLHGESASNPDLSLNVTPMLARHRRLTCTLLSIDPSGLFLASVSRDSELSLSCLSLWEAATGEFIGWSDSLPLISSICFTSDGSYILAGCSDGSLLLFKLSMELRRDSRLALLGGSSPGAGYDLHQEHHVTAGHDRWLQAQEQVDASLRALPNSSGKSIQQLWENKEISFKR